MSFYAMADAVKSKPNKSTEKFVLLMISSYCGDNYQAYPSTKTLSEDCCLSERAVQRAISGLEKQGFLSVKQRFLSDGRSTSNIYILDFDGKPKICRKKATAPENKGVHICHPHNGGGAYLSPMGAYLPPPSELIKETISISKRENAPTEPEFNFKKYDLILIFIFNSLKNESFEFSDDEENTVHSKLGDYLRWCLEKKKRPNQSGAKNFVKNGILDLRKLSRRNAEISAAMDNRASSVAKQINAQAESIDRKTLLISNEKGLTFEEKINDRSWVDDEFSLDF